MAGSWALQEEEVAEPFEESLGSEVQRDLVVDHCNEKLRKGESSNEGIL